jgi:hypothetical protein
LGALFALSSLLLGFCAHAEDRAVCSFCMQQPLRARGDSFTLSVTNGPAEAATATVKLGRVRDGQMVQIDNPRYLGFLNHFIPRK